MKVKKWKIVVWLTFLFLFTFLLSAVMWAILSWSSISTDELLWHLRTSLDGADTGLIVEFVLVTIGTSTVVTAGAGYAFCKLRKKSEKVERYTLCAIRAVTILNLLLSVVAAWFGFGIGTYIKEYNNATTFIRDEYVDPASVKMVFPGKKRNLIFIYLESMEVTFMDRENGGAFSQNVIPDLTEMAHKYEDFSGADKKPNGGVSLPGTIWTMGAVFGTTSGLPLKIPLERNSMNQNKDFFPQLTTMGDIFAKEGYQNRLLMGSDANFGGCRLYYESHGNFTIHDYEYAKETGRIPMDYKEWWGYEDRKLFGFAKDELEELSKSDQPFQLVIQTMDTHRPDGYHCPECNDTFSDNVYANVMDCSSRHVDEFIRWVQKQDFYQNTTIVITGDHPTMDNDFCADVPEEYERKTYLCIIHPVNSPKDATKRRYFSTIDLLPTTLSAMGVRIEGGRLGLGTDLFSDQKTLLEKYGREKVEAELSARSKLMEDMFYGDYDPKTVAAKEP